MQQRKKKVMLNVIKGETRKLNKLIYPNAAVRLIANIAGKVKASIKSYQQSRSIKEEMLSIRLKQKPVEYGKKQNGKDKENKNELRESAKQVLDAYKKKGAKVKSKEEENKTAQKNENNLLPKKRINPNHGRSIY